jgi:signal transduction histidine kinase
MKLLQKNTRYLLKFLPLILLGCTLLFFLLLRKQTLHLQKEQLLLKQKNVFDELKSGHLNINQSVTGEFEIKEITGNAVLITEPMDTVITYPARKEAVPFQMMRTIISFSGKRYALTTFVSSKEITHLKIAVFGSQFLIYLILFFAIFRINQRLSITLWRPFYRTTNSLDSYDIHLQQAPELETSTGIDEFNELNKAIKQLSDRNTQAYNNQKQFVENASHEIQTPLAVIRSKVELLMEQPELSATSAELIMDIGDANNRLSKMNHTLILLSKIQNNQFLERSDVNLSEIVDKNLKNLSGYYLENMPVCRLEMGNPVILKANAELMDILCSNLLRNAIIHNRPSGSIKIKLDFTHLLIENTGDALDIDPQLLFERFRTANTKLIKTTGLGLSLVKQICDLHGFKATYTYEDSLHRIRINFYTKA